MTTAPLPDAPVPTPVLDLILRQVPCDVILLDTDLVCRYAAPMDDRFLGVARDELIGRHIADVWPPAAGDLMPVFEQAARQAARWRHANYEFRHGRIGIPDDNCVNVTIEPFTLNDFRGVIVILLDTREIRDLSSESARLNAQLRALREQERVRALAVMDLDYALRNLLTPLIGYLQLLSRRSGSPMWPALRAIVEERLPALTRQLFATLDRLTSPPVLPEPIDAAANDANADRGF